MYNKPLPYQNHYMPYKKTPDPENVNHFLTKQ